MRTQSQMCRLSRFGLFEFIHLKKLKRISEDWKAARLLGNQECQHTALEMALRCHWEANCSTSPCNSDFMGLFTMEKVRWYLQELKFLLKMRWSEAERDSSFFLPCSLLKWQLHAVYQKHQLNFFLTVLPPSCILSSIKKCGGRTTHSNQHNKEEGCSGDEEMRLTLLQKLLAWDCTRQRNWRISQQLFIFLGAGRFIFCCESAWIRATRHLFIAKVVIFELGWRIWANVMPRVQLGRAYKWLQVLGLFLWDLAPQNHSPWLMRVHNSGLCVSFQNARETISYLSSAPALS